MRRRYNPADCVSLGDGKKNQDEAAFLCTFGSSVCVCVWFLTHFFPTSHLNPTAVIISTAFTFTVHEC